MRPVGVATILFVLGVSPCAWGVDLKCVVEARTYGTTPSSATYDPLVVCMRLATLMDDFRNKDAPIPSFGTPKAELTEKNAKELQEKLAAIGDKQKNNFDKVIIERDGVGSIIVYSDPASTNRFVIGGRGEAVASAEISLEEVRRLVAWLRSVNQRPVGKAGIAVSWEPAGSLSVYDKAMISTVPPIELK